MINATSSVTDKNSLEMKEMDWVSSLSFEAFQIKEGISRQAAERKIELLEHYSSYLVKLLKAGFVKTDEEKLALTKLAAKLKRQAERLEIISGKVKMSDIKIAAEHFGKKAQSSVGGTRILEPEK